jgi:autotransporter-associated beta strand protein
MALVLNAGKVVFANTSGLAADRGVTINSGTLQLSGLNSNLINDAQSFTMNGGVFDLNGKAEAVAAISGSSGAVIRNSVGASATLYVGGGPGGSSSASFAGVIEDGVGKLNLTKEGSGTQTLTGINTYSGDTSVNQAGSLILADNAGLKFSIGISGVNNRVKGTGGAGSVTLDGDFTFDLAGAGTTVGDMWTIVDASGLASASYGGTFTASSTLGSFSNLGSGLWSINENSVTYQFSTSTGVLQVVPEPGTFAMMLGRLGMLTLLRRRRA